MTSVFVTRLLKNWGIVAKQEYLRKTVYDFEKEVDFSLKDANTYMLRQRQVLFRTNMFHMNEGGCALVLQKDLEYWIIGGWRSFYQT